MIDPRLGERTLKELALTLLAFWAQEASERLSKEGYSEPLEQHADEVERYRIAILDAAAREGATRANLAGERQAARAEAVTRYLYACPTCEHKTEARAMGEQICPWCGALVLLREREAP
jgi:hypothetical protein